MNLPEIKTFLDKQVEIFNQGSFIENDPISVPHRFTNQQDIEIMGLWTSILSWGLRKTILSKGRELCELMDDKPYDFVLNHTENDLRRMTKFCHRTFNATDTLCFLSFFQWYYSQYATLEDAFLGYDKEGNLSIKAGIERFHNLFTNAPDFISRTRKHVSTPANNSSCKRINMFLRWMVRKDDMGVDFGIWNRIPMDKLMIPLDVHVFKVAKKLNLISRNKADWKAVEELTANLKTMDPFDPVKYDFALFGLGVSGKIH